MRLAGCEWADAVPVRGALREGGDRGAAGKRLRHGHAGKGAACEATEEDRALGRAVHGERVEAGGAIPPDLLCDAARRDDVAGIEALLAAGADIEACNAGEYGTPPLHWAAWRGRLAAVRTLVEHGADIHWTNCWGGAALGTAIHGSENCFDPDGGPAMRLPEEAFPGQYVEIVEYLIARGAKLPESIWGGSEAVREALRRHGVPDGGRRSSLADKDNLKGCLILQWRELLSSKDIKGRCPRPRVPAFEAAPNR